MKDVTIKLEAKTSNNSNPTGYVTDDETATPISKKKRMENSCGWSVGVAFLMEATRNGYYRLRDAVRKAYQLEDTNIPTYYYLTKFRPKLNHFIMNINNLFTHLSREKKLKTVSNKIGKSSLSDDVPTKNKCPNRYLGQLKCSLAQNIEHMFNKVERLFDDDNFFTQLNEPILILCSLDGSRH